MFGVTKAVESAVNEINKRFDNSGKESSVVTSIINKKEKYFEENNFLWNSDLMFRVWRMTFLNLMKNDGFGDQVKKFNESIRKENKRKKRYNYIKKWGGDIGSTLNDLENQINELRRKQPTKPRHQLIEHKTHEKERNIVHAIKQLLNSLYHSGRLDRSSNKRLMDSLYDTGGIKKEKINKVTEAMSSILRGVQITNEQIMRDLVDMVKSTLGVCIVSEFGGNIGSNIISKQREAYIEIMMLLGIVNGTSKHLNELSNSDIEFITIKTHDDYNRSFYDECMNKKIILDGFKTNNDNTVRMITPILKLGNIISELSDDDFYTDSIDFEMMRRAIKNEKLLHQLGLYGRYRKYKEMIEKKKKDKAAEDVLSKTTATEFVNYKKPLRPKPIMARQYG